MKYDKNLEDVNDYLQNELFKPDEMIILPPAGGKWSGLLEICAKAGGLGYDIDDVKEAVREILEKEYPEEYDAKTVNNIIDKAYGLSAPESIGDKKWKYVTTEQVWNAIIGSPLMEIVQDLQAVTKPTLPLQATLSKALVLAGAVMAGKIENAPSFDDPVDRRSGADLSRFKINTGDGQTTNLWGFIVGQSASGKDIGGRLDKLARYYGLSIGSCGSAEGLQDAYMDFGNGILSISEFEPYLKSNTWQHNAVSWLIYSFDKGWFKSLLSSRQNTKKRESNYCFSSLVANIQPNIFTAYANHAIVDNGFLSRCLISIMPNNIYPASTNAGNMERAVNALDYYRQLKGNILMPDWYMDEINACLTDLPDNSIIRPFGVRLIQQIAPKIACILQADGKTITKDTWQRTKTIAYWYLRQAEELAESMCDNPRNAPFERLAKRIYRGICKHQKLSKTQISRNYHKGSTAKERDAALQELEDRGLIRADAIYYFPTDATLDIESISAPEQFQTCCLPTPDSVNRLYGHISLDEICCDALTMDTSTTTTTTTTTTLPPSTDLKDDLVFDPDDVNFGMS